MVKIVEFSSDDLGYDVEDVIIYMRNDPCFIDIITSQ